MDHLAGEALYEIIFQDTPLGSILVFLLLWAVWSFGSWTLREVRAAFARRQRRREMAAIPNHELPIHNL